MFPFKEVCEWPLCTCNKQQAKTIRVFKQISLLIRKYCWADLSSLELAWLSTTSLRTSHTLASDSYFSVLLQWSSKCRVSPAFLGDVLQILPTSKSKVGLFSFPASNWHKSFCNWNKIIGLTDCGVYLCQGQYVMLPSGWINIGQLRTSFYQAHLILYCWGPATTQLRHVTLNWESTNSYKQLYAILAAHKVPTRWWFVQFQRQDYCWLRVCCRWAQYSSLHLD